MKLYLSKIFKSRYTYMFLVSSIIWYLLKTLQPNLSAVNQKGNDFFTSVLLTFLIWEGNLFLDRKISKYFLWTEKPLRRVVVQATINIIYTGGLIYFALKMYDKFVCTLPIETSRQMLSYSIVIGGLVSLLLLATEISSQFFKQWKLSLIEVEKYKKESVEAKFQVLKSQINPHFLFNNLSVLSSLVYSDADKAVEFINQFSKVYRYVMESNDKELVELETEISFIKSYCFLLEIRFGKGFRCNLKIDEKSKSKRIPPMALQILVENTIKHNLCSTESPLMVILKTEQDYLSISNNVQLKNRNESSSGIGLENIKKRYHHFTDKKVMIESNDSFFTVRIPLITPP